VRKYFIRRFDVRWVWGLFRGNAKDDHNQELPSGCCGWSHISFARRFVVPCCWQRVPRYGLSSSRPLEERADEEPDEADPGILPNAATAGHDIPRCS
jgi:hypothetical protein